MRGLQMGKALQYKKDTVLSAVKDSKGIITTIAKRLKCSWHTAETYCNKYPESRRALKDENEKILDICESLLIESIEKNKDINNAKWMLSKKGKVRGYTDNRLSVDMLPEKIEIILPKDLKKMSDEQLQSIIGDE